MSEITTTEALAALPADGSRVPLDAVLPGYPRRDVREVLAELFLVGRATMLHGEGWGRVLPDETTPTGARSTETAPAGATWTAESAVDYVLERLDADDQEARDLWEGHKAARADSGEDDGADETPVADAWLVAELTRRGHQPPAGARSTGERPRFPGDPESYSHHASEPVTDPHGSVIDIDGERFVIGRSTDEHVGTDTFRFPLFTYDYTLVSAGARFTPEQMGASIDHVEIVAETKEMDAGSGPAAQYVAVRRLADGRVLVAVGSDDEGTEVWAAVDPHSWETIRAL